MTRFILPIILVAITIGIFFTFTKSLYQNIQDLRAQQVSYNEALTNSKALENERDKLTQKYNSIGGENLDKLKKLLPENVDNIRLILEIEKVAMPYGMTLKDVRYSPNKTVETVAGAGEIQGGTLSAASSDYGIWDLEFSITGTYNNFINFVKDLEHNLRIVDISSVEFSSSGDNGLKSTAEITYQYKFKIKTYWLKN